MLRKTRYVTFIFVCIFTVACSTSPYDNLPFESDIPNLEPKLGFSVQQLADNYYHITYKTKVVWGLSSFKDSWMQWNKKAKEICNSQNVVRLREQETMGNKNPPGWLQTVSAQADCTGTAEQAMIEEHKRAEEEKKSKYVALSTQSPCSVDVSANNIDDIYIWAHDFFKYELYTSSFACFQKVLEYAPDNTESMEHITHMYENGLGIEKDLKKATYWNNKSKAD